MREMGYRVARKHAARLRRIAGSLGIGLPVVLLLLAATLDGGATVLPLFLAALCGSAGAVVERWLFFAEATHVVTTYYGPGKIGRPAGRDRVCQYVYISVGAVTL